MVKLWSVDGQELKTLKRHSAPVYSVSFSPNQNNLLLASASGDKTVILWNLDLDDLQKRGCQWLDDYLKYNPNGKEFQVLCKDTAPSKPIHKAQTPWEQAMAFLTQLFKL